MFFFLSVTFQTAVHLGSDYMENLRSTRNQAKQRLTDSSPCGERQLWWLTGLFNLELQKLTYFLTQLGGTNTEPVKAWRRKIKWFVTKLLHTRKLWLVSRQTEKRVIFDQRGKKRKQKKRKKKLKRNAIFKNGKIQKISKILKKTKIHEIKKFLNEKIKKWKNKIKNINKKQKNQKNQKKGFQGVIHTQDGSKNKKIYSWEMFQKSRSNWEQKHEKIIFFKKKKIPPPSPPPPPKKWILKVAFRPSDVLLVETRYSKELDPIDGEPRSGRWCPQGVSVTGGSGLAKVPNLRVWNILLPWVAHAGGRGDNERPVVAPSSQRGRNLQFDARRGDWAVLKGKWSPLGTVMTGMRPGRRLRLVKTFNIGEMGGSSPWTRPRAPGCGDTLKASI